MFKRNSIFDHVIKVGQRVQCTLSHAGLGTVVEIQGEQSPETCKTMFRGVAVSGGSATLSVIWDNGNQSNIPEALARASVQWDIFPEIATAEEVAELKVLAAKKEQERIDAKDRAQKEFEAEKERLINDPQFSMLKQATEGESSTKLAGANIRKLLKARFPGIKFSVRKDGNTSIRISWEDGPTHKSVDAEVQRFKLGGFDGMTDSYHYNRTPWVDVFGGVEYVFCDRQRSDALIQKAIDQVWDEYAANVKGLEKPTPEGLRAGHFNLVHIPGISETVSQLIRQASVDLAG